MSHVTYTHTFITSSCIQYFFFIFQKVKTNFIVLSIKVLCLFSDGFLSDSVEVDIKSCVISVIELYTHWLASPIHTLQLQFTLQSILMLSDIFAVVRLTNVKHNIMLVLAIYYYYYLKQRYKTPEIYY